MESLPAQRTLLAQNRDRPERVPALERERVVEDVQDAKAHPTASTACGRRLRGGVQTQEGVEHQERPERRAVVPRSGLMRLENAIEIARIEEPRVEESRPEHRLTDPRAKRPAEPLGNGHGEAHLWPIEDFARQQWLHRFLQQVLPFRAPDLQRRGQRSQPFDERVVHQGLANLERVRHAGAIDLRVDITDQVGVQVDVLDERERILRLRAGSVPLEHVDGAVAAQLGLQALTEQRLPHRTAQDAHLLEVGFHGISREGLEGRLGAQRARSLRQLGIRLAEPAEQGAAEARRKHRSQPLFPEVGTVTAVAAEALVAAVARQRDGHVLARELAYPVCRNRRAVGIGLVVRLRQRVDQAEIVAVDGFGEVPGPTALRNRVGERGLVESGFREGDGAGVDRVGGQARHRCDHGARVDPSRQEGTERHVGDHAQPHGLAQPGPELLAGLALGEGIVQAEAHVPVLARRGHGLIAADRERMRRRELPRRAEDRAGLRHVPEREVLFHRERIDLAAESRMHEQRLQLRAEDERAVGEQRVVQRLDAQAVARKEQGFPSGVPQRECEHSAEPVHAALLPRLPGADDDFRVAAGAEPVPEPLQLPDERLEVVDLAVEHDHHRPVLAVERLMAGR